MATNLEHLNWIKREPDPGCPIGATFEAITNCGAHYLLVPNVHKPQLMFALRLGSGKSPAGWYKEVDGKIHKIG